MEFILGLAEGETRGLAMTGVYNPNRAIMAGAYRSPRVTPVEGVLGQSGLP